MSKKETLDKMTFMFSSARYDSCKSQQWMANQLGVSKKTIQNWEDGTSFPTLPYSYDWFNALCVPPQPYVLDLLYPDVDSNHFDNEQEIEKTLEHLCKDMPMHMKKKLVFILNGKHGSSPVTVIDMMVANLQTPLRDRLNVCQTIVSNYKMSDALGQLTDATAVRPSVQNLSNALNKAIMAVRERRNSYLNC